MTTMFDVGDVMKVTFVGKVTGYSIRQDRDDSYQIELANADGDVLDTIFLSTRNLKQMDAKKVVVVKDPSGISSRPILMEVT